MELQAVFSRIVPSLGSSVMRFPLAAGIAAIFAFFHVFELDDAFGLSNRESIRVSLGLISAFFWTLGVALLGERAMTLGGPGRAVCHWHRRDRGIARLP